ncbi:family 20 glycosylhydrolase [Paenibacillus sp. EC2-1]|uniref:family 20 glycosylhydrolase n=1 Tax=Paenibacillus sp. EC2-1 TaxID=3388665 RepID=UPI003BEEDE08
MDELKASRTYMASLSFNREVVRMFKIIPEPKQVQFHQGSFKICGALKLITPEAVYQQSHKLADLLQNQYNVDVQQRQGDQYEIILCREDETNQYFMPPLKIDREEAYRIHITSDCIVIQAIEASGLYYGLQTLIQIIEDHENIPSCEIVDWPDMKIRGVHFDLKGGVPTGEYLADLIKELGHYKINTILMEYEDKLQYSGHPKLATKSALSQADVQQLVKLADQHHIQIIPLVQALGHAEYMIRHDEYAHLRESHDWNQQMCPCHPGSFELFSDLFQELIRLHPNSNYFHIGGDEAHQLGECPSCAKIEQEVGKYALYAEYIAKICHYVIEAGKTPIIWDDMFTRHAPELMCKLPKETVLMYWNYRFTYETMPTVDGFDGTLISSQWLHKSNGKDPGVVNDVSKLLEHASQEEWDFIEQYGGGEKFPTQINSTIFLQYIQDQGFKVIGASAAQMMRDTILADPSRALPNIREWSKAVVKHQALGVVATGWTRNNGMDPLNGLIEGMRYEFVAAGEYCWSHDRTTIEAFDEKFCRRFYRLNKTFKAPENLAVTDAIWLIRHQQRLPRSISLSNLFQQFAEAAECNRHNLLYYGYMAEQFSLQRKMDNLMMQLEKYLYKHRYYVLSDREAMHYRNSLEKTKVMIQRYEQEGIDIFRKLVHSEEIDDCLHSLLDWHKERLHFMRDSLSRVMN